MLVQAQRGRIVCIQRLVIPSTFLVVLRIQGGGRKLGALANDLFDGIEEVAFRGDLSSGPNGKHAGLYISLVLTSHREHRGSLIINLEWLAHLGSDTLQLGTGRVGAETGNEVVSNITLHRHTTRQLPGFDNAPIHSAVLTSCRGSSRYAPGPQHPAS